MALIGKLFALAAISALMLGIVPWPSLRAGGYTIAVGDRSYGFGLEYWAFSAGAIFAVFSALYYWLPIFFPQSLNIRMSYLHFWLSAAAAFGFLLLGPGLQALGTSRKGAAPEKYVIATLVIAIVSALLFFAAQAIFIVNCLRYITFGKNISA